MSLEMKDKRHSSLRDRISSSPNFTERQKELILQEVSGVSKSYDLTGLLEKVFQSLFSLGINSLSPIERREIDMILIDYGFSPLGGVPR